MTCSKICEARSDERGGTPAASIGWSGASARGTVPSRMATTEGAGIMSASNLTAAATKPLPALTPVAAQPAERPSWRTAIELTLLGAVWGGSFLFMRVAAADFGPFALVDLRLALGALILVPFFWRERARFTPAL